MADRERDRDREGAEAYEERRAGPADRRQSAWADPRFWVSVTGLLLTIGLTILGYIAAQLTSIQASVQTTRDLVLTQGAKQTAEIEALQERVGKLETAMDTQAKAYNFNFTTRLANVEAKVGVQPRKEE